MALLLAPECVSFVMGMNQIQLSMREFAKVMQPGLEVPLHVVCAFAYQCPYISLCSYIKRITELNRDDNECNKLCMKLYSLWLKVLNTSNPNIVV